MTVSAVAVSVAASPAAATKVIDTAPGGNQALANVVSVAVFNNGSVTAWLGDSAVTAATGFPLAAGASIAIDLRDQATRSSLALYAIAASVVELRVLAVSP